MLPAGWLIASLAAARRQNLPFCAARSWHTLHRPPVLPRQGGVPRMHDNAVPRSARNYVQAAGLRVSMPIGV